MRNIFIYIQPTNLIVSYPTRRFQLILVYWWVEDYNFFFLTWVCSISFLSIYLLIIYLIIISASYPFSFYVTNNFHVFSLVFLTFIYFRQKAQNFLTIVPNICPLKKKINIFTFQCKSKENIGVEMLSQVITYLLLISLKLVQLGIE